MTRSAPSPSPVHQSDLVFFAGPWTPDEQAHLTSAITAFEAALGPATRPGLRGMGAAWVAVSAMAAGERWVMASRQGHVGVYRQTTPQALADAIEAAALKQRS